MTLFGGLKERILIEGLMPERALLRLKRANIPVYNAKKVKNRQILFRVRRKDVEKVFAIYPNVCYNESVHTPYVARKLGAEGLGKCVEFLSRRIGLFLGALFSLAVMAYFDGYVFSVDFIGTDAYRREVMVALEEAGIKPFSPYKTGREDLVCARILALKDVEFCSVKKSGGRVLVEVRTSPFPTRVTDGGKMYAKHEGTLLSMTVLRGTPLKAAGDTVVRGEALVDNAFFTQEGEQVRVEPIARARIACVYVCVVEAKSEEEAFAAAYLSAGIEETDGLQKTEIAEENGLYRIHMEYTVTESINF